MKKTGLILVLFALLVGCASTGQSKAVEKTAPDFIVTDVSGDEVRLSDFKEKNNVVLIFYADNG
jgi:cytochrome oxidase Cu insertion factor (SCO1/SenC/PrrC family)